MVTPNPTLAVVTGGSRGIGLSIAKRLAKKHDIVIVCRNAPSEESVAELKNVRTDAVIHYEIGPDCAETQKALNEIFNSIDSKFPDHKLSVFVHNAGLYLPGQQAAQKLGIDSVEGSEAALYYQNLYGMFFAQAIERCAKRMDNTGRIVGISSPGCNATSPPRTGYLLPGSGKALMEYYMRQYARLLAPKGITVNVVVPGHVLTSAWGPGFTGTGGQNSLIDWIKERSPMNRPIDAEEVANAVAYLTSVEAGAVTGQAMACDGGLSSFT
ncbi:hypothetical protein BC943DRAFT_359712 [Umbelopsis sp. AD052]|nr:hypothetical protein BC943DRAFT_359712 [Umbelopsis sp. AD052]